MESGAESKSSGEPDREPDATRQRELLRAAAEKAGAGDLDGMAALLHASRYLDGLVRQLSAKWTALEMEDVEDSISDAVVDLTGAVRSGKKISTLAGYLWKAADRNCSDQASRKQREWNVDSARIPDAPSETAGSDEDGMDSDVVGSAARWSYAIRIARHLAARLQVSSERAVMVLLLDAVEKGIADTLTSRQIGDVLGLTPANVRKAKERAFSKIARMAREEGLWEADFELASLGLDADDHHEQESTDDE